MKMRYLLILFSVISISQLAQATTFKIVDCIHSTIPSSAQRPKVGVLYYERNIGRIAPIYYGKKPVYHEPDKIVFKRKLIGGNSWTQAMAYGIAGTTPGGLTLLSGVRFYRYTPEKGMEVYEAMFDPGQEPSRLAVNVLITINSEERDGAKRYYCYLYHNSLLSSVAEKIYFRRVSELYP